MDNNAEKKKTIEAMSDDELFAQAFELERLNDDSWDEVADSKIHMLRGELKIRATRDILDKCEIFSTSTQWEERAFSADVLAELGIRNPSGKDHSEIFTAERATILIEMLKDEADPRVLESIIIAFGHFKVEDAVPLIVVHKDSTDSDIRQRVAWSLGGYEHDSAIDTLLMLMNDEDDDVRDWATFGIGSQSDVDTPQIRDALFKLLDDEHDGVNYEALNGLCRRNDPRGIKRLIKIIETKEADEWFLNIAAESKSKEILSALVEIDEDELTDPVIRSAWEHAIDECGGEVERLQE